jgi:hypothetical protein
LIGSNTLDIKYAELQGKMQKYPFKTMKELEELKVKVSSLENTLSYLPEAVLRQQSNKKRAGKSKGKGVNNVVKVCASWLILGTIFLCK